MSIRLLPLAGESLGVRSMCTYVETEDLKILLDAGAALGPRHGLLPHPREYRALAAARKEIREYAEKASIITISHYHFDHFTYPWPRVEALWTWSSKDEARAIYEGKKVYVKDFRSKINASQRRRAYEFHKALKGFAEFIPSDGIEESFGSTRLRFVGPFSHGEEEGGLGYVVCVVIEQHDQSVCFYPDLQGPLDPHALALLERERPQILIIGGPPVYLKGYKVTDEQIQRAIQNLRMAINFTREVVLVEHHLLRDGEGIALLEDLRREATKKGVRLSTFAEFRGVKPNFLEAKRKELYALQPPDEDFMRWTRLPPAERENVLPPF
jgi:predicted metallo-beta-lactamase superfamily hydrolase